MCTLRVDIVYEREEDMIKLFVSDLDDTLVYDVNHMQKEDERALCWLAEKGTNICFASGRFTHRIDEVVKGLHSHITQLA